MDPRIVNVTALKAANKLSLDNKCCKATRNKHKRRTSKAVRREMKKAEEE